ncbi:unnamed protein product [Bursaphelenchus okinawaensis]|uniref:glucuronosyltransferase n=1 Tax=Bursaphelenchus okinawaensis TaxID=465554 RepID=A0A811KYE3_9BILA|nr:unnamed protein product [Bursaphelenchus okinawaensis]CAG9114214.1 unnamed protein product [Bursaphelenchus okinawaensis]
MIIYARVTLIQTDKPNLKPIGPAMCSVELCTRSNREKLILKIGCQKNKRLDCVNLISQQSCKLLIPREEDKITFVLSRTSQNLLLAGLQPGVRKNIILVVNHFRNGQNSPPEQLSVINKILCGTAHSQSVDLAKELVMGKKKLELTGKDAEEDFRSRTAYPASLESLMIQFPISLDNRPFKCLNLKKLRLKMKIDVNNHKDMKNLKGLRMLKLLEELDLSDNGLMDLPDEVYESFPGNLKELNLSQNNLTVLPESLMHLPRLIHLDAARNQIHTVHTSIHKLISLRIFFISYNQLTFLPLSLFQRRKFEILSYFENNFEQNPTQSRHVNMDIGVYQLQVMCIVKLLNMGMKLSQMFPSNFKNNLYMNQCYQCHKYMYREHYVEEYLDGRTKTHIHVDLNMEKDRLLKSLWQNPGPYEDASPLNHKIFLKFLKISSVMVDACKYIFADHALLQQLHDENYDVGFVEQYDACGLGLLQRIEVEAVVWLSATAIYRLQPEQIGVNYPLGYVPELFSSFSEHMTFPQRILNTLVAKVTELTHKFYSIDFENQLIRLKSDRHQLRLNLMSYATNVELVLTNISPVFDFTAPQSTLIQHIAGITVADPDVTVDLSPEWKIVADEASEGFILITFGAIAKTSEMPEGIWNSLERAMNRFGNVLFIVKYESLANKDSYLRKNNVVLTTWIPQMALMKHQNYRGVITHGGWSTVLESISNGRPMILMPLFADHFKNARVITEKSLGIYVDKMNVKNETFTMALGDIIHDERYTMNTKKYSKLLYDTVIPTKRFLISSVDRAIRRNRASHWKQVVRPKCLDLNFIQLYYLDLIGVIMAVIIVVSKVIKSFL